jgi:hypothetical protein
MKFSDSDTLKSLNRKTRQILDGKDGDDPSIREAVQLYVEKLMHYKKGIDLIETCECETYPLYDPDNSEPPIAIGDLESLRFMYSFDFEALVWFIAGEVRSFDKENSEGKSDKPDKKEKGNGS